MTRILIVDDELPVRETLAAILREADGTYQVDSASNGEEALASAFAQRPDVVLLDVRMPGLHGLSVLKFIRGFDASIRVIMVTGYTTDGAFAEAMKAGAFAIIPKPFDGRYIQHLVAAALNSGPRPVKS